MGYKISDRGEYLLSDSLPQFLGSDHREWCSNRVENDNLIWEIPKDCLEFHTSWDWLMPVAEKCLTSDEKTDGQHYFINDALLTCNIEVVYDRVVEFIKQYNK